MTDDVACSDDTEQSGTYVATRECPHCDWEVEREIRHGIDEHDLDYRADRHYEREHCGKVKVQVTLEAEWVLHPGQDARKLSKAALESFEDEPSPGFEAAHSRAEILEECDIQTDT